MVMEDEYVYDDEDDNYDDVDAGGEPDPKWRTLSPKERRELMKNVFSNSDWYEGIPVFDGGDANPMFETISEKAEAPLREVRRYYAAWLKSQGFSPTNAMKPKDETMGLGSSSIAATTPSSISSPLDSVSTGFSTPPPLPTAPPPGAGQTDMGNLMTFLIHQQNIQMQQQHFQLQMMMEQRRLDQGRETEQRRETMARDAQSSNQQMAFMREMMKKGGDDGFFDTEMKGIFKERMVDSMFGEKDDSWKESIKDVLGSDTMKAAVGGLGGALAGATKKNIPAGYDQPDYNPYAQVPIQVAQPEQQPMPIQVSQPVSVPPPQQMDGVFFEEAQQVEQPQSLPVQEAVPVQIPQFSDDEYKKILFEAFTEAMGPVANDPQVLSALQEQIDVAVATTVIEVPEALPQIKLQKMNEKLLLIRNLRDIGMGMMDLRERTPGGEAPSDLMVAAGVADLRTNPEFYKIFADNTYDELMAKIEPFKNTGAVEQDYLYLQKAEVQEVCRHLLQAVKNDALQNGMPQMPSLV